MSGAEMLVLAERCEAAEGADRVIDVAIADIVGWDNKRIAKLRSASPNNTMEAIASSANHKHGYAKDVPRYTASIDAVLDLISGQYWSVNEHGYAKVTLHRVIIEKHADGVGFDDHHLTYEATSCAATPALALCAAALRALADLDGAQ